MRDMAPWLREALCLVLLGGNAAACLGQATGPPNDAGWGDVLNHSVDALRIEVAPTLPELQHARVRTQKAVENARTGGSESQVSSAKACWLQINLEYQRFLDETDPPARADVAGHIQRWADEIRRGLWDQNVASSAGQSAAAWADVLLFVNAVDGEARRYAPPLRRLEDDIRLRVFDILSPGTGSAYAANRSISETVSNTFVTLRTLADAAISAKVLAANALHQQYGSPPRDRKAGNLELRRDGDFRTLYPSEPPDWDRIEQLITSVTTPNQTLEGVASDYLALARQMKWDDPVIGIKDFAHEFDENATYPFRGERASMSLVKLDGGYGDVPLVTLMEQVNRAAPSLEHRAQRGTSSLEFPIARAHEHLEAPKPLERNGQENRADRAVAALEAQRAGLLMTGGDRATILRDLVCDTTIRRPFVDLRGLYVGGDAETSQKKVDEWVAEWAKRFEPDVPAPGGKASAPHDPKPPAVEKAGAAWVPGPGGPPGRATRVARGAYAVLVVAPAVTVGRAAGQPEADDVPGAAPVPLRDLVVAAHRRLATATGAATATEAGPPVGSDPRATPIGELTALRTSLSDHHGRRGLPTHQQTLVDQTIALIDERLATLSGNPLANGTSSDPLDAQLQERIAQHPDFQAVGKRLGTVKKQISDVNTKSQAIAAAYVSLRELGRKLNDTAGDHKTKVEQFQALAKRIRELGTEPPALQLTPKERETIRAHADQPERSPLPAEFAEPPTTEQYAKTIRWCEARLVLWEARLARTQREQTKHLGPLATPQSIDSTIAVLKRPENFPRDDRERLKGAWDVVRGSLALPSK